MYNGLGITRGFSLGKIVNGLSKTLRVANQIIPIYQKAMPVIQNARNMFGMLKEFKPSSPKSNQVLSATPLSEPIKTIEKEKTSSTPTFFL